MSRPYMVAPGIDPTQQEYPLEGPHLSGCLVKIGLILALIFFGLWIISATRPQQPVAALPTLAEFPTDRPTDLPTSTPTRFTNTPVLLPSNTPAPTTTGTPTATPGWTGCVTIDCMMIPGHPLYDATLAMAQYWTMVAPLTPSATPTVTRTPTRTTTAKPGRRTVGSSQGSSAAAGQPQSSSPIKAIVIPGETAVPAIRATDSPPVPTLPNCAPGILGLMSSDPNTPVYQITTTPLPECVGRQPTLQETPSATSTPQEMLAETAMPTVELSSETFTPTSPPAELLLPTETASPTPTTGEPPL